MVSKALYTGALGVSDLNTVYGSTWLSAIESGKTDVMLSVLPNSYPATVKVFMRQVGPTGTATWALHWDGAYVIASDPGTGLYTHLPYVLGSKVDGIIVQSSVAGTVLVESTSF
jgi:hypothetical protein